MYQLEVGSGSSFKTFWKNFIRDLKDKTNWNSTNAYDALDGELKKYSASNPGPFDSYIEFENEEDAIAFVLKWS